MIYGKRTYSQQPVEVTAIHTRTGMTVPVRLKWDDGRTWDVELVGHPRNAKARRTGILATLYPIAIRFAPGKKVTKNLYLGKDGIWFVEAVDPPKEGELIYNPLPYTQGLAYSGSDYDTDEC